MEIHALGVIAFLTHWVWPIFLFVFGLGAVVFVHELGHFLVAKAVGIRVERFALGFGPRVCGYRGKETDYSIMLLPLGGYVKMLGQDDIAPLKEGEELDSRSYLSKSVGARFAVISAGVIMNVIFAAIMFVIIGMIGMPVPAPVVGGTVPGYPGSSSEITWVDQSGKPIDPASADYPKDQPKTLTVGDRMKTLDGDGLMLKLLGRDIVRFRQVIIQAALSDVTDEYTLGIERKVGDKTLRGKLMLSLKMGPSPGRTGGQLPSFGIMPATSTKLSRGERFVPRKGDIFKKNDKIVAINGQKVEHHWDIEEIEKTLLGGETKITVERTIDEKTTRVDLVIPLPMVTSTEVFYLKDGEILRGKAYIDNKEETLSLITGKGADQVKRKVAIKNLVNTNTKKGYILSKELLDVLGMIPRIQVGAVSKGSPADKAGLQADDIIVRYGHHLAPTHLKLKELNKTFAFDGADIVVMRDGKVLEPINIQPKISGKTVLLGVAVGSDMGNLVVGGVRENSPADDLEITGGDVIEKVNGKDVKTWAQLLATLNTLQDKDVELTVRRGENRSNKKIPSLSKLIFDKSDYVTRLHSEPWRYKGLMDPKVSRGPIAALAWGGRETMFFVTTSYATLRSLIKQTVSPKELSGPVGIGSMAIAAGRRGMI
ncbi:MAG: site-2 protease family protein, partial [Phycisphaerae bacterium]|nr:site-2 protease family protein [Phycisphaerae bacterium]